MLDKYLITDPHYYGNTPQAIKINLQKSFQNHNVDMICFRDKFSIDLEELFKSFVTICKKFKIKKILINSNIELAIKYKIDGVHLTSNDFDKIKKAKKLGLFVIISCHTKKDIKKAIKYKADAITYSPIFYTPNKGLPKGTKKLKKIVAKYYNIDIYALGGIINKKQILKIKDINLKGFASIRYFAN